MLKTFFKTITAILIYTAAHAGLWWYIFKTHNLSLDEHSVIENAQALSILGGALIFVLATILHKGFERIFFLNLVLLCAAFFFREVTLADFDLPAIIIWFSRDLGLNLLMSISWSTFTIIYLFNMKKFLGVLIPWVKSPAGICVISTGVFLVLSLPFDKTIFPLEPQINRFWEEFTEMNGFSLLIASAVLSLRYKTNQ